MLVLGWQLLIGAFCILGIETFALGALGGSSPITADSLLTAIGLGHLIDSAVYHMHLPQWIITGPLWPLLCLLGACFAAIGHLRLCRGYYA